MSNVSVPITPTWRGHQVAHQFISGDEREDSVMEGLVMGLEVGTFHRGKHGDTILRLDRRNQWMQRFPARNVILEGHDLLFFAACRLQPKMRVVVIGHWDPAPFRSGSKFHCTSMLVLDDPGISYNQVVEVPADVS